jgi:protein gp37
MADHSAIEWTEATWNPTSGCTKVSPGCDRCYAERMALRFPKTFPNGFDLTLRPDPLELPLHWRRPRTIFVNSMSDLFHVDVPDAYIADVFGVMAKTPQHTYQVLTKRAERLGRLAPRLPWPANVWMGVSVETPKYRWRIDVMSVVQDRTYGLSLKVIAADPLNVILQNESPSLSFYSQFSGDLSSDRNSMTGRWNGRPAPWIFRRVP